MFITVYLIYAFVLRCKSYSSIPNFCTLVQDPNDACCSTVRCNVNGQQLTPLIPDGRPTPSPTLAPNMINVVPLGTHTVITGSGLPNGQVPGATGGRSKIIAKCLILVLIKKKNINTYSQCILKAKPFSTIANKQMPKAGVLCFFFSPRVSGLYHYFVHYAIVCSRGFVLKV